MSSEVENLDLKDKEHITITWKDGHTSKYHVKWIRFHCRCEKCFRSFSGMYPLDTMKFPDDFYFKSANVADNELHFTTDYEIFENHCGRIPLDWLRVFCSCNQCFEKLTSERESKFDNSVTSSISYNDISGENGLFNLLGRILNSGFCLIHDVPNDDTPGQISDRIGPKFYTLFSETFGKNGNQIGDGPFQDYPFYEVVPGVQIIYPKRTDEKKSFTLLTDLLNAAEILRRESPDHFDSLVRIPATFQYKKRTESCEPFWFEIQKPHIEIDYFGKVVAVHWNPTMEGKLRIHQKDVMAYCKAHNAFDRILKQKSCQISLQLREGTMLIFNNKRMAHNHKGYDESSIKTLLHADDVKSKYVVLGHKLGKTAIPMKIGNRSSF
ncbi:uncharacterized protein LOC120345893 [Styela clava]